MPNPLFPGPVHLQDQFAQSTHTSLILHHLGIPAEKNGVPLQDDRTHLLWWEIMDPQPERDLLVSNQFRSEQPWTVAGRSIPDQCGSQER